MKARPIHCVLFALAVLAVASTASAAPAGCQMNPDLEMPLISNGFFEAINGSHVRFEEGVYWEIVETKDGKTQLRYGVDPSRLVAGGIDCRCLHPTVCTESNCEITGTGTGNAKCRGGCYREDGTPCTSCRFLASDAEPIEK